MWWDLKIQVLKKAIWFLSKKIYYQQISEHSQSPGEILQQPEILSAMKTELFKIPSLIHHDVLVFTGQGGRKREGDDPEC